MILYKSLELLNAGSPEENARLRPVYFDIGSIELLRAHERCFCLGFDDENHEDCSEEFTEVYLKSKELIVIHESFSNVIEKLLENKVDIIA